MHFYRQMEDLLPLVLQWLVVGIEIVHGDQMVVKSAASVITAVSVSVVEYNNKLESNSGVVFVGYVRLCNTFLHFNLLTQFLPCFR